MTHNSIETLHSQRFHQLSDEAPPLARSICVPPPCSMACIAKYFPSECASLRRANPEYILQCSPAPAAQIGHGTKSFCLAVRSLFFMELPYQALGSGNVPFSAVLSFKRENASAAQNSDSGETRVRSAGRRDSAPVLSLHPYVRRRAVTAKAPAPSKAVKLTGQHNLWHQRLAAVSASGAVAFSCDCSSRARSSSFFSLPSTAESPMCSSCRTPSASIV
jgi:hypothetical protein